MKTRLTVLALLSMTSGVALATPFETLYTFTTPWTIYSGTEVLPTVRAPNGTMVAPVKAPPTEPSVIGTPGFNVTKGAVSPSQTGIVVLPGGLVEITRFYKYISGPALTYLCVNNAATGNVTGSQCMGFNVLKGQVKTAAGSIPAYSVVPYGTDGWYQIMILVSIPANLAPANDQIGVWMQGAPGETFATASGKLITAQHNVIN